MGISNLIDKLNNELEKLNKLKNDNIDINNFYTDNIHFNDDISWDSSDDASINNDNDNNEHEIPDLANPNNNSAIYSDIEPNTEIKALVEQKPSFLISAQNMFKRTTRFSLKAFLISISISFLNLFI